MNRKNKARKRNNKRMKAGKEIAEYALLSEAEIPLFKVGLVIALIEYPKCDIDGEIAKQDSLEKRVELHGRGT